MAGDVIKET